MAKAFFKNDNLYSLSIPGFKIPGIIIKPGKYVSGNYYLTEYERYGLTYVGDDVTVDPIEDLIYDYVEVLTGADMTPAVPEGLATLDATGKLDLDQLPQLAISDTYVVADQAARLGLNVQVGDVAIQTDNGQTYILAADPASTESNWKTIAAASGILGSGTTNDIPYWVNSTTLGSSPISINPTTGTVSIDVSGVTQHLSFLRDEVEILAIKQGNIGAIGLGTGPNNYGYNFYINGSTVIPIISSAQYAYFADSGSHVALTVDVPNDAIYFGNAQDIGLARSSAGVVKVTDGSTGIGALLSSVKVTANTGTATPAATDSRTVYTNQGDADGSTITLPSAAAGLEYTVCVTDGQTVTVNAAAGDNIRVVSNLSATAGNVSSNTVGSVLRLVAIDSTTWLAVSVLGTWSVN